MNWTNQQLWERYQQYYTEFPPIGLALDCSRMTFGADFFTSMKPRLDQAFQDMAALEKGAIANPDENRMVGHYWLRNPELAPTPEISREITQTLAVIQSFATQVHNGSVTGGRGAFKNLLLIGIGGSALGPQFVGHALGEPTTDKMGLFFFDNTDPDGMDKVLSQIITELGQTLVLVISKSGGTKETRNGMLEAEAAYQRAGLNFSAHAVAVTGLGSELDQYAVRRGWLKRFPMWDWVGGRTSELSAVGLLPAALQGINIEELLAGARACDVITRIPDCARNPAAQMALMWFHGCGGRGNKDLVIIPYKDRLELISRYLQQLIMESLGKEKDLDGKVVNQGLAVYGNKGSTDQHAYVQQLRDGVHNFFATFIQVLNDRRTPSLLVEPDVTAGDYLFGFLQGTRDALFEKDRESITLTIREVSPFTVGMLIALYERTVGLYASLIHINAYHQPGVEAGKKAAGVVITLQRQTLQYLREKRGNGYTVAQIAAGLRALDQQESIFKVCEHLAANPDHQVTRQGGKTPFEATYQIL